ncbi:MAG: hypothetical protein ACRCX2_08120 [Paraclostridium sp.]
MVTLTEKRPEEEIIKDILYIKSLIANPNQEERIDDMTIRYRSIKDLKDILFQLEEELDDVRGVKTRQYTTGIRRGYQR